MQSHACRQSRTQQPEQQRTASLASTSSVASDGVAPPASPFTHATFGGGATEFGAPREDLPGDFEERGDAGDAPEGTPGSQARTLSFSKSMGVEEHASSLGRMFSGAQCGQAAAQHCELDHIIADLLGERFSFMSAQQLTAACSQCASGLPC